MTSAGDTNKPKLARGIKITLILSLALNLIVAGMIVGAFLRKPPPSHRAGGGYIMPYFKALSLEERRKIFKKPHGAPNQDLHRARHAAFQQMLDALRAEPFDRDAVAGVLEQQMQMNMRMQSGLQERWLDVVAAMSPEKRQLYVQAVAGELARRGGKSDKR